MASYNKQEKPVRDDGLAPRDIPYRAGGKQQGSLAGRKNALLGTGPVGYLPGRAGQGAGLVDVAPRQAGPVPGFDDMEYGPRPMPREIPVHTQSTHFGNVTRYLDGHSEIHRERPGLAELLGNPHVHPDDKEDIRAEIAHRDAVHNHRYW